MVRKTFDAIAGHIAPDIDCGASVWLLRRWGESHFSKISTAKFIAWPAGPAPEMSAEKWREEKGVLAVDVGHGLYDHHNPELREHNDCSFEIVAQALGRINDPALQNILRICRLQDKSGKGYNTRGDKNARIISLINMINGWNMIHADDPEKVIDLICQALDGIYAMENDWLKAEKDFKYAESREVQIGREKVTVAYINSSTRQIGKVIREEVKRSGKRTICIINNAASEQTRIIAPRNINLKWVALRLRVLDAWYGRQEIPEEKVSIGYLTSLGTLPESPAFHFAFPNLLLNRSLKNPKAPRMKIFPDRLLEIVVDSLENNLPTGQSCTRKNGCSFIRSNIFDQL